MGVTTRARLNQLKLYIYILYIHIVAIVDAGRLVLSLLFRVLNLGLSSCGLDSVRHTFWPHACFFGAVKTCRSPLFLGFFQVRLVGSFVAVGGFCGHRRGTPGSSTLVSWSPGYLDDLTLVWCKVRSEDPSVGLTIERIRSTY